MLRWEDDRRLGRISGDYSPPVKIFCFRRALRNWESQYDMRAIPSNGSCVSHALFNANREILILIVAFFRRFRVIFISPLLRRGFGIEKYLSMFSYSRLDLLLPVKIYCVILVCTLNLSAIGLYRGKRSARPLES